MSWLRREPGRVQKNRTVVLEEQFIVVGGHDQGGSQERVTSADGLHGVANLGNAGHGAYFNWRWPDHFLSLNKAQLYGVGAATGASWDYQIGASGFVDGESVGVDAGATNTTGNIAIVNDQLFSLDVSGVFAAAQQVASDWMVFGVTQTDAGIDAYILGLWVQYKVSLLR